MCTWARKLPRVLSLRSVMDQAAQSLKGSHGGGVAEVAPPAFGGAATFLLLRNTLAGLHERLRAATLLKPSG